MAPTLKEIREKILGKPQGPPIKTEIVGGASDDPRKKFQINGKKDHRAIVKECKEIYLRGGPIGDAIDAYPLFTLTNGYRIIGDEGREDLVNQVIDWLEEQNIYLDAIIWQGILDAIICGTAFQEIVYDRSGRVWGIIPRDASSFEVQYDQFGRITGYVQYVQEGIPGVERKIGIEPERLLTLTLFPNPGDPYGVSLIYRARDDIYRDTNTIDSIAMAIHRHGTGKHDVTVGEPGDIISREQLEIIKKEFKNMSTNDFFIHGPGIHISDIGGTLTGLSDYSNIMLQRLACALGVPEEILGLGRGSTEATATVRLKAFYDKISTIQAIVSRVYSKEIFDRITGVPGVVWLEFNDVSPQDEKQKAEWISMLRTGLDADAICPAWWVREQFGIPPDTEIEEPKETEESEE